MRKQIQKRDSARLMEQALPLLIKGELTQGQIAQQIGVGLRTLSRWRCEVLKETVDTTRRERYEEWLATYRQQYAEAEERRRQEHAAATQERLAAMYTDPFGLSTLKRRGRNAKYALRRKTKASIQ